MSPRSLYLGRGSERTPPDKSDSGEEEELILAGDLKARSMVGREE